MTTELEILRKQIDAVDDALAPLLIRRLSLVREVGKIKQKEMIGVKDAGREETILARLSENVPAEDLPYLKEVYRTLFALNYKEEQ